MMVHCPHCERRAVLIDIGVITRPECPHCARPLPMPGLPFTADAPRRGPMSPRPRRGRVLQVAHPA